MLRSLTSSCGPLTEAARTSADLRGSRSGSVGAGCIPDLAGEALRGAQEEDGVHLRHVEPLVQDVHREQEGEPARAQLLDQAGAIGIAGLAREDRRGDLLFREHARHVAGEADVDAEAVPLHGRQLGHVPRQRGSYLIFRATATRDAPVVRFFCGRDPAHR